MSLMPLRFSALRQMSKSPAHYAEHIRQEQAATSSMDIGTAADLMILGGRKVVVYPGLVRRGKVFDEFKAANAGNLIVLQSEYDKAAGIRDAVAACDDAMHILMGIRQHTVYWTMNGRECRGTPDVIGENYIADLKTGETSDPRRFHWKVKQFAYHAAAAWYINGIRLEPTGFLQDWRVDASYIVAVEQAPPHVVTVFRLTDHVLDLGERLWRTWFEQLQVCESSGRFPAYSQSIVDLDLPDDEDIDLGDAVEIVSVSE